MNFFIINLIIIINIYYTSYTYIHWWRHTLLTAASIVGYSRYWRLAACRIQATNWLYANVYAHFTKDGRWRGLRPQGLELLAQLTWPAGPGFAAQAMPRGCIILVKNSSNRCNYRFELIFALSRYYYQLVTLFIWAHLFIYSFDDMLLSCRWCLLTCLSRW